MKLSFLLLIVFLSSSCCMVGAVYKNKCVKVDGEKTFSCEGDLPTSK